MSLLSVLFVILLGVLLVAWLDGGRQEQRLIVEPVELPQPESGQ